MVTQNLVTVASYNVNGVVNPIKRSKILNKMEKRRGGGGFITGDPPNREGT